MLTNISVAVIPLLVMAVIVFGLIKKQPVFDSFTEGAKTGIETSFKILPTLAGLIIAISMLRASGAFDIVCEILTPVLKPLNFPSELVPLALMRPVSGSGSLAILTDMLNTYGPDSFVGLCACVMMGSTETTFYTVSVYFGSVGIKNIRYTLKAALLADMAGIIASVMFVYLFLF